MEPAHLVAGPGACPGSGVGPRRSGRSAGGIETEIANLSRLSRTDLAIRWRLAFGGDPPKGISMRLRAGALAYALQAKRYGGLRMTVRRRLDAPDEAGSPNVQPVPAAPREVRPGTRLVREWNGATHVVDVIEGGYVWNGEHHASLSAIARAITGARWSGPRFFGLTGQRAP